MRGKILRLWLVLPILCIMMLSLPLAQAEAAFRSSSGAKGGNSHGVNSSRPRSGSLGGTQPSVAAVLPVPLNNGGYMPPLKYTWNDYNNIKYSSVYCGPNGIITCSQPTNNTFSFSGAIDTVYLLGYVQGLTACQDCYVGIYDGDNTLVDTISGIPADRDSLSPLNCLVGSGYKDPGTGVSYPEIFVNLNSLSKDKPGTWHACVFEGVPPGTYPSNINPQTSGVSPACTPCNGYLAECPFIVQKSIPEFPSAAAPVSVIGLSAGIYCWLRKRGLATPVA